MIFRDGRRWSLLCLAFFSCFSHFFSSFLLPMLGKCWTCLWFAILQELLPNRILLITIHNPLYPITVDVLHQVFSPHGFVEKIVTFQKSAGQLLFCLFYDPSLCLFSCLSSIFSLLLGTCALRGECGGVERDV
jgi:hypothetical protein